MTSSEHQYHTVVGINCISDVEELKQALVPWLADLFSRENFQEIAFWINNKFKTHRCGIVGSFLAYIWHQDHFLAGIPRGQK